MSVWVEIGSQLYQALTYPRSRSTWACELKFLLQSNRKIKNRSRSTWACELKSSINRVSNLPFWSRSTWACELKSFSCPAVSSLGCHAPRERVSWNYECSWHSAWWVRHAPRERVSWNHYIITSLLPQSVTLHVSVWVEMQYSCGQVFWPQVTLHVSVWVEIVVLGISVTGNKSRSTWACELKLPITNKFTANTKVTLHVSVWVEILVHFYNTFGSVSRSTWACELKFWFFCVILKNMVSRSTWACELKC